MGCKYLAEALSRDGSPGLQLSNLDLRNNNIDSEGAAYLAEALKTNSTITTLDLRWNRVRTHISVYISSMHSLMLVIFPYLQMKNTWLCFIEFVAYLHMRVLCTYVCMYIVDRRPWSCGVQERSQVVFCKGLLRWEPAIRKRGQGSQRVGQPDHIYFRGRVNRNPATTGRENFG